VREEELTEAGGAAARPFAPEELVACEACARANAPTRLHCLYCGVPLPVTERSAGLRRPALRKLEEWEAGFSVILRPGGARAPELDEVASELRVGPELLLECLDEGRALPLARVGSRGEAELIVGRLAARGIETELLGDDELRVGEPQRRARAFGLTDETLALVGSPDEEPRRVAWGGLALLVAGRIVRKRVEVEERRERSRREGEVVGARELTADEAVLDLYADGGEGWRVLADNFDYSCLGPRKSLLARDNFAALADLLRERAQRAVFDDDYTRLRRLLAAAWPPSEREDALGLRREGAGRYTTGAVTSVSNEPQFTRYSRLRWHLLRRGRETPT
jgi:hypothetical protein